MINENSFYDPTDQAKKDKFLKSPTKLGNAFWINFLGFCALYDINKDFAPLHQYLNKKVQLSSITDDSNDLMLIIKILRMKKLLKPNVSNEITKLLARLKILKDDKIDQVLLRKLCKKIPITKVKPSTKIKPYIVNFVKGVDSLDTVVDPFYNWARKQKTNDEFRTLCRKMKTSIASTDFSTVTNPTATLTPKIVTPKDNSGSITGTADYYKKIYNTYPINPDFPFIKGNKDMAKLFLLKFVNYHYMYKIKKVKESNFRTQLKKFNTSSKEIMNIVSEEDFKDMYLTSFPKNHKILTDFYNRHPIFSPITENLFKSYNRFFYNVFPYKYWLKENLKGQTIDFFNRSVPTDDLKELSKWDESDLNDLKSEIEESTLINFKSYSLQFLKIIKNLKSKKFETYINSILYAYKDFIFKHTNKLSLKQFLEDFPDWIEQWYKVTNQANKDAFKSKVYFFDLFSLTPFISKEDFNEKDMAYNAFKQWVIYKGSAYHDRFKDIDPIDWLMQQGLEAKFQKDFEGEEFDHLFDFTMLSTSQENFLNKITDIIIKRKNPFKWKKDNIRHFFNNMDYIKSPNPKLFNFIMKMFFKYLLTTKILLTSFNVKLFRKYINEDNFIQFYSNNVNKASYLNFMYVENISAIFIQKNFDKIVELSGMGKKSEKEFNLFLKVAKEKNWLLFGKEKFKEIEKDSNYYTDNNLKKDLFDVIITKKINQPKEKYKELYDYTLQSYKNNTDNIYVLLISGDNLKSKNFRKFIIDNFKEQLQDNADIIDKLAHSLREPESLYKLFYELYDGNEMDIVNALVKHIHSGSNYLLQQLQYFHNTHAISYLIENNEYLKSQIKKNNMPTLLSDYGLLDTVQNGLDKLTPNEFDELIDTLFSSKKITTVVNGIRQKILYSALVSEIYDDEKSLIQPIEKLTKARINQVLKFNNVSVKMPPGLRRKKNEQLKPYLDRIRKNTGMLAASEPLHIDKIEETEEELEIKSAEYMKYYNFKHGNSAIEFLESFNVDLESEEHKQWVKDHPKPTVIPAFHGTGSIGASMILRYGFKVLKSSDKSVVGRMLGNGIYVSNIIEKAAQYCGDHGFSRRVGTVGYILETECYLGQENIDYRSAGTGNDTIRSPEYCLFNPRAQIKIVKAHKVIMTTKNHIKALKQKYADKLQDSHYFDKYDTFRLDEETKKLKNTIDYIFYDGTVLDENGKEMEFEDFDEKYKDNSNVYVSPGQLGPVITIKTSADVLGSVHIPSTHLFKLNNPENLYDKYLTILNDVINPTNNDWE